MPSPMPATAAALTAELAVASVRESMVSASRPAHGARRTSGSAEHSRYAATSQGPATGVSPAAAAFCRCSITLTTTAPIPAVATNRAVPAIRKSRLRHRGGTPAAGAGNL
ncbi:hypothetical protein NicSoilC12_02600 [Arthrobacter sp. NicSoilC12]|nr:hypothetical protein NicSoilC12_02600 [Arthrobacter sp. NicSoilC12]